MKPDPTDPVPVPAEQTGPSSQSKLHSFWGDLRFGLPVWLLLCVLVPLSWLIWSLADTNVHEGARERFHAIAEVNAHSVRNRIEQYESVLVTGSELFDFDASTARRRWREFALPLQRLFGGVQGIGYAEWVKAEQRDGFVERVRAEGFPSFDIKPSGIRNEYTSILYLEPFEGRNLRAFGYDMWSESTRRQAMSRARDTGRPSMTGRVTLVQETSHDVQPGLLIFVPVYRSATPLHTVDQRREALRGFVYSPFRVKDLMRSVHGAADPLVSFSVFVGVDTVPEALLYDSREELPARLSSHASSFVHHVPIDVAGQVWTLRFQSLPEFEERNGHDMPVLILLVTLLLDLLLVLFVAQLGGLRLRVEERAARITADLRHSEAELQRSNQEISESNRKLHEVSELHRAVMANAGYAFIATDAQGIITIFNPCAERMLGYSAEELIGRKSPALFHDASEVAERARQFSQELHIDLQPGFEVFVARCRRRLPNEFEWSYIRKDGSRVPVVLSVTALSDSMNRITGFLGIAVDISERKRAEARIAASMREVRDLKAALDAHAIVSIADRQGRIIYANDNFCAISRYTRGELLGQDHRLINSGYHTRDFFREMYATISRGQIWQGEVRNRSKDGNVFWADTTIIPFLDERGSIFEYVVIRIDITMRKQAEQGRQATEALLRQFITHTPAAIAMLDADMRFLHVSDRWIGDFCLADSRVVGTQLLEHEELPSKWKDVFLDVMAGSVKSCEEDSFARSDGSIEWIQWEMRPWQKSDGSVGGVMIFSQIVTARRQLDQRLTQQNRALARSNSELEQFTYIASHDLQEPLRAVSGCVEILQSRYKGRLDERADELIFHTVDGARRMQTLITDLLLYSRIGTKDSELTSCDVSELVGSALLNLGAQSIGADAQILYPEMPTVQGDRAELVLVFQNLIGNALKFRGEKAPLIELRASQDAGFWHLSVSDNGIGIDPRYFDRVFGIFQRLHTRAQYPGTGIGLAICRKVIERHGGRIWVESQPGVGSVFHFTLPIPGSSSQEPPGAARKSP